MGLRPCHMTMTRKINLKNRADHKAILMPYLAGLLPFMVIFEWMLWCQSGPPAYHHHHDLTYSEVHATIRNRKNWVSKEWSMMFLWNKKVLKVTLMQIWMFGLIWKQHLQDFVFSILRIIELFTWKVCIFLKT